MFYLTFVLYQTLLYTFIINLVSASGNESVEINTLDPSHNLPSDNITSLIDEVIKDIVENNSSLLELANVLHNNSTDGAVTDKEHSRRFLKWIKNVFKKNATHTSTDRNKKSLHSKQAVLDQTVLIDVLRNLTKVIEKLNRNIEIQASMDPMRVVPLTVQKGHHKFTRRGKREAQANVAHTYASKNSIDLSDSSLPSTNPDVASTAPCVPTNHHPGRESNPAVKEKLLGFLNDTFHEIESKIRPVQQIRKQYAADNAFKIGYIIANIDTLEVSIMNLKKDMDLNNNQWEDKRILELFDKIVVSNKVVTGLIDSLNEKQKPFVNTL